MPNPVETPRTLTMQLSTGRFDISRAAALADAHRFGFESGEEASRHLGALLARIADGFNQVAHWLEEPWQMALQARMQQNISILGPSGMPPRH